MNDRNLRPAIMLMGPTAVGKTALALALHDTLPVEIVSVDSSQVYRGLDIGTAKPTPEERTRAPHSLIDIREPTESYSAAEFCVNALHEIQRITAAGRIPLLVGGTMFYFHALEFGLSMLPGAAPEIRRRLSAEAEQKGWSTLHARLSVIDPVAAGRIDPHDAQRIQRALELIELTGKPVSTLTRPAEKRPSYRFVKVALWPQDRSALHVRIAQRFQTMLERGLIAEVEGFYRRDDLNLEFPSMRTVGYRQVWHYLTGTGSYNQMIEQAIAATRQVAKRQMTWLRSYPDVECYETDGHSPCEAVRRRLQHLEG